MSRMFSSCTGLNNLNISSFNTSNVSTMNAMFANCTSLTSLSLLSFRSNSLTDFDYAFAYCTSLQSIWFSSSFTLSYSCSVNYALRIVGRATTTTIRCNSQTKSRLQNAEPGSGVVWALY